MNKNILHIQFLEEVEKNWTNDRPDGCIASTSKEAIQNFIKNCKWMNPDLDEYSRTVGDVVFFTVKDEVISMLEKSENGAIYLSRSDTNKLLGDHVKNHKTT